MKAKADISYQCTKCGRMLESVYVGKTTILKCGTVACEHSSKLYRAPLVTLTEVEVKSIEE